MIESHSLPPIALKLAEIFGPDEWGLLIFNDSFVEALWRVNDEPSMDATMKMEREALEAVWN